MPGRTVAPRLRLLSLLGLVPLALAGCEPPAATGDAGTTATGDAARDAFTPPRDGAPEVDAATPPPDDTGIVPSDAGPPPPDPCVAAGNCEPGRWVDVTPSGVSLLEGSCGNYGTTTVAVAPGHPNELFAQFNCQGIWRSTDYGQTWAGPVNTGMHGAEVGDCAGGISVPSLGAGDATTLYLSCIRGAGLGFWRSTNGGVDWTRYPITPTPDRQDYYAPAVDPYDPSHLIMAGHEMDAMVESTDGGQTWTLIPIDPGMHQSGGTPALFFIDRGAAAATRSTFLWLAQGSGGGIGTWRTENGGTSWTRVDSNEHGHGNSQIYQPDGDGVIYMAGVYSALGWGILRSADYGVHWEHVGATGNQSNVWGTSTHVYGGESWAIGGGMPIDPSLQVAPQPGTTGWTPMTAPAAMFQGPAQVAVTRDPDHAILIGACWQAGLWRYIEP
ncbi:MAG: hypothetical protein U0234_23765 [Sandaracinus sp.]